MKPFLLTMVFVLVATAAYAQFGAFSQPPVQSYNQFAPQQVPVYTPLSPKNQAMLRDLERKAEKARETEACFQKSLQSRKQELQSALQRIQQLEMERRVPQYQFGSSYGQNPPFQQRW